MISVQYTTSNQTLIKECLISRIKGTSFNERDLFYSVVNGVISASNSNDLTTDNVDISVISSMLLSRDNTDIDVLLDHLCCDLNMDKRKSCLIVISSERSNKKQAIVSTIELAQKLISNLSESFTNYLLENEKALIQ